MDDNLSANMYVGLLDKPHVADLFCIGMGKVVEISDNFVVELAFRTSSFSDSNQKIIAKKVGLLGYELEIGDLVLLGQARTLNEGFKSKMDLSVAYILDKVEPAKGMSVKIVDTFDFLDSAGNKLLSISPSGVEIFKPVTADTISAKSVEANGVKLETHTHQAGLLVAPNGPVTGTTGGPL